MSRESGPDLLADAPFQKPKSDPDLHTDTLTQAAGLQWAPPGLEQVEHSSDGDHLEANTPITQQRK